MAASLRPPKVLDPGPMPRGRHRGAQSSDRGYANFQELREGEFRSDRERRSSQNSTPRTWVNRALDLASPKSYPLTSWAPLSTDTDTSALQLHLKHPESCLTLPHTMP